MELKVRGEYAGLCTACMQFRARVAGPPPPRPGVESDTRALDFYIARRRERIARHQETRKRHSNDLTPQNRVNTHPL